MGRWAQAKRRGSSGIGTAGPNPPPAPWLGLIGGYLAQTAQGGDDPGGQIFLYFKETEGAAWTLTRQSPWERTHIYGIQNDFDPGFFKANEMGNGGAYVGTSPDSEIFEIEAPP